MGPRVEPSVIAAENLNGEVASVASVGEVRLMQVILSSSRLESLKVLAISTRSRPEKKFLADEGAGIAINEFLANKKACARPSGAGGPEYEETQGNGAALEHLKAEAGRLNQSRQNEKTHGQSDLIPVTIPVKLRKKAES